MKSSINKDKDIALKLNYEHVSGSFKDAVNYMKNNPNNEFMLRKELGKYFNFSIISELNDLKVTSEYNNKSLFSGTVILIWTAYTFSKSFLSELGKNSADLLFRFPDLLFQNKEDKKYFKQFCDTLVGRYVLSFSESKSGEIPKGEKYTRVTPIDSYYVKKDTQN